MPPPPPRRVPGRTAGSGPSELLATLDLMCPFSRRALPVLRSLAARLEGRLRVRVLLWPQPWHPQTCRLARAVLAAAQLAELAGADADAAAAGDRAFFEALAALYARQEAWADARVEDTTPRELYAQLAEALGDVLGARGTAAFQERVRGAEVTAELKTHLKYGRQNGLHVSPTYLVNGVVQPDGSSGWDADRWVEVLAPAL